MRPVKKRAAFLLFPFLALAAVAAVPQAGTVEDAYVSTEVMIPMRDGVKLHTRILAPRKKNGPLPFLLQRTPYGVAEVEKRLDGGFQTLAEDGYIFVFQD